MRHQRILAIVAATAAVSMFATSARAVIAYSVGNNPSGPTNIVSVNSGPLNSIPHFALSAGIVSDSSAGNLLKDFTNTSTGSPGNPNAGISSGTNVPIDETFTNTGAASWAAWDEAILTQTDFGGGNFGPGFLFDPSLTVLRNGSTLTQGTDYTLTGVPFTGSGNNGNQSLTITFASGSEILPTDTLEILKSIHEVFGDSNVWALNEVARVAEFPTAVPEPTALGLLALALPTLSRRRARRAARIENPKR